MIRLKSTLYLLVLSAIWVCCLALEGACVPLMVEKNLFAQDRKPPSPESAAPAAQPNKSGLSAKAVQLDGVFIRGDARKALIRVKGQIPGAEKGKTQNPYVTVQEGEKIGDLQVVKIEPRSISVEKDGQTEVVKLFAEGKVVIPAPPVPASPAAAPPAPQHPGQPPAGQAPGQPPAPPMPPGQQAGANMPGINQPPGVANPPGGRRVAPPPAQNQADVNLAPEDEGDVEEEASEEPSS